jgi:hypothetical protein
MIEMVGIEETKREARVLITEKQTPKMGILQLIESLRVYSSSDPEAAALYKSLLELKERDPAAGLIPSLSALPIQGDGKFACDIVGESYYQDNLEIISGGRTYDGVDVKKTARVIFDNLNPYDEKAIRIEIDNMTVGHLSRMAARDYRGQVQKMGAEGRTGTCAARIVGGWKRGPDDIWKFGVKLDIPVAKSKPAWRGLLSCSLVFIIIIIVGIIIAILTTSN